VIRSDEAESAATKALARWLAGATGGNVRAVRYQRLGGGAIQDNYALDVDIQGGPWHGVHRWVLRTNAPSSVTASASRADEFEWLRMAHQAGVLAPKPLFLCSDASVLGREFFVMERLPGVAAGHRLTRDAALVPDADALVFALGANLARIHAIRPSPQASPASGKGRGRAEGRSDNPALVAIATYRAWLDRFDDAYPALEWGLRWCELHAPAEFDVTLVHRDYRTGNYLVDAGKLVGVLDWEFAGWGDSREDLGWFTARCWRFAGREREAGGIASVEPFLAGYASVSGHAISRDDLDYWQAMAHIRWAIIALEQARRHRREPSLELALTGRIVDELEYEVLRLTGTRAT
jgi:aminoglycoside phosphotransferase (APT) family kinase protein